MAKKGTREFAARLRALMAARGMNGLDLERESGLSRQSIYRWMNAESYPYIPALCVLRKTFGCTWADLLGEDGS